jgi:hypothetical protein
MRIFQNQWFDKWASKGGLSDESLIKAVQEIEKGLIDASLGGHVYKMRVGLHGRGKRGGARTLLAYQKGNKAFFIYGFVKNTKDNITKKELEALKLYANTLFIY